MAGMGQSCNHVATAMYRIEAAVRNGLANHFWLPNHKDVQPMKVKEINFGREDFCQRGKKKRPFVSTLKKTYNPLSEQGDMKMLMMNDFAEGMKDVCTESILFSAGRKPDVDFVTDHAKKQIDEVLKIFCCIYDWISELLTRRQNKNKLWYNYKKGVISASKAHSILTKMNTILKLTGGCVDMWLICQNMPGLFFLITLIYLP